MIITENMIYVYGSLAGIAYGSIVGLGKYFFLWKKILQNNDGNTQSGSVYKKMIISYIVNFITLVSLLFLRKYIPFEFTSMAIGTAIALSFAGRAIPMKKILNSVDDDKNFKEELK